MTGRIIVKCSACRGKFSWDSGRLDSLLKCPLCGSITEFLKIIEMDVSRAALPSFSRGKAYMGEGKYNRAIAHFSRALDVDCHCAPAYYYRGRCYCHNGENDRAISDLSRLIGMDPAYASAYYHRGRAYRKLGNRGECVSDLRKYLELEPDGEHASDAIKMIEGAAKV